jgi:hypothetical protein
VNLTEGARRLALLLGVAGAILGGFASYTELQSVLGQRARHIKFEQLANSAVVKQARKQLPIDLSAGGNSDTPQIDPSTGGMGEAPSFRAPRAQNPPYAATAEPPGSEPGHPAPRDQMSPQNDIAQAWLGFDENRRQALLKKMTPAQKANLRRALEQSGHSASEQEERLFVQEDSKQQTQSDPIQEFIALPEDQQMAILKQLAPEKQDKLLAEVKARRTAGIKAIHWTGANAVESIETEDDQTLYPTPAPSAWYYLLIALVPFLGFFIPWGAVRAIGWVGTGFVSGPK